MVDSIDSKLSNFSPTDVANHRTFIFFLSVYNWLFYCLKKSWQQVVLPDPYFGFEYQLMKNVEDIWIKCLENDQTSIETYRQVNQKIRKMKGWHLKSHISPSSEPIFNILFSKCRKDGSFELISFFVIFISFLFISKRWLSFALNPKKILQIYSHIHSNCQQIWNRL